MIKIPKKIIANAGLLYATVTWGSTFIVIKDGLTGVTPAVLVAYRFILAAIIIMAGLLLFRKNIFEKLKYGLVMGSILWVTVMLQTVGLKYTKASNSAFITGLFVLFVPVFAYFMFKSKPSAAKAAATLMAVLGLWILTGGISEINFGDILTLLTAVGVAFHVVMAEKIMQKKVNPFILNFQQLFVTGIFSFAYIFIAGDSFLISNSKSFWSIIYLALIPTISAYVIQLIAQKYTSAVDVAIIFSMESVFGAVFAWTIGGENVTAAGIIGGIIIVSAMLISELRNSKGEKIINETIEKV